MPRITEKDLTVSQQLALARFKLQLHLDANSDRKAGEPEKSTVFVIDNNGFFCSAAEGRTFVFPYNPHSRVNPIGKWVELCDDGNFVGPYETDELDVDELIYSEVLA